MFTKPCLIIILGDLNVDIMKTINIQNTKKQLDFMEEFELNHNSNFN
jgi:hypothetical protein